MNLNKVYEGGVENRAGINQLENQISEECLEAMSQKTIPKELLDKINYYKENLKNPIRLVLSGSNMTDDALKLLDGLPIKELDLLECPNLTKNCLTTIGRMQSINNLQLGSNDWVNDEVLAEIPSNIKTLSLATCANFTGQGLANLRKTHVRSLDLFGCNHLKDEDFVQLPNQFNDLNLGMCRKVGPKTIDKLSHMSKLQHLNIIGDANVTDQSLYMLSKDLLTLKISGCSVSDGAFKPISKMEKLQELALSNTDISGKELSSLPLSLVRISLDGCKKLTDKDIIPLSERENLRYLGIDRCPNITGEFLKPFSKTQIKVDWQTQGLDF